MNEDKKDFNKKLNDSKNLPKIVKLDEKASKVWGGNSMVVAPPIDYDILIKSVPKGKLITIHELRNKIAKKYKTDLTCPLTAGIFVNICAWASFQRNKDITPYWRVLKTDGSLNEKFPHYPTLQKELLEKEGYVVCPKGKNKIKYYVQNFQEHLHNFNS